MRSFLLTTLFAVLTASLPIDTPKELSNRNIPSTDGVLVLDVVNKYRTAYNLPTLAWNEELAFEAVVVGEENGGVAYTHYLYDDDSAQLIVSGPTNDIAGVDMQGFSPFEATLVGGWLCDVPTDPQISTLCPKIIPNILNYQHTGTLDHDILVNPTYKNIGCWFTADPAASTTSEFQGIWICNFN